MGMGGGLLSMADNIESGASNNNMVASLSRCLAAVLLALTAARANCEELLEVSNLTTAVVEFVYSDLSSGRGLRVLSSRDSLHLSTLDGCRLIAADEASGGTVRLITLGHTMFIQAKTGSGGRRDFFIPDAFTGIVSNADEKVLRDLVRVLNTSTTQRENDARLVSSLLELLRYPELQLLQNAVSALASDGVTGLQYPSILSFYLTALNLERLAQRSNLIADCSLRRVQGKARGRHQRDVMEDCLGECPPCPYQECLGMCGYGCNCWKWVCGDCCYHLGCYDHDICCREKFVQTACLFPFNFRCEYGYTCD